MVSLIDRHGEMVLTYAKVHTCDFDPVEATCTPGDSFPVCTLGTAQGPVKVGAMICYDREFPESARMLILGGAELILVPNVCDMELNFIAQVRTRAIENMVASPWPTMPRRMPMGIPSPLIPSPSPSTVRVIAWSLRPVNRKEST